MSRVWRVMRDIRLDILVADLAGTCTGGTVEAVLAANPGLADLGPVVPIGTTIIVPDLPSPAPVGRRVWE